MEDSSFVFVNNGSNYSSPNHSMSSQEWTFINDLLSPLLSPSSGYQLSISDPLSFKEWLEEEEIMLEDGTLSPEYYVEEDLELNIEQEIFNDVMSNSSKKREKSSLIRTPEFLTSFRRFNENMSKIAKDISNQCIQSSRNTAIKMKSISNGIREESYNYTYYCVVGI
ncbi:hypothetical protein DLAC_09944 [Tieghemostelium lacteum]|uniref:Uncharacterized protein n=1 Tax=Tieghemostelium lacteum TaxID=361077 RepID=A0A151Z652_TIELA|nr:hypothetical protein DLAC_09944 [Tieghemostelium lacteum]|eukprot:KYQ89284.1 hypothetical protein DLAC_09944 [Tieghemostelium lacteum]